MRLPDDAELLILRGVFEVPSKGLIFTQLGTARPNTLKGFIKWDAYPVEMAATRCVNRATRFAVGAPVSKDELPGGKDDSDVVTDELVAQPEQNGQTQQQEELPDMATTERLQSLLDRSDALCRQGAITQKQAEGISKRLSSGTVTVAKAKEVEQFLTDKRNEFLEKRNKESETTA